MNLITKPFGTIYAVLQNPQHLADKHKIESTEYFRFRLHGANVRVRELGDQYVAKNINIKSAVSITSVNAIVKECDINAYSRMPFYDSKDLALLHLELQLKKFSEALMVEIKVVTNSIKGKA